MTQWQPRRSEQAFPRFVRRHWRGYFPKLLSPSAFHRQARHLEGVLAEVLEPSHRRGGQRQGPTDPLAPRHGGDPPAGRLYLDDQGFTGAVWQRHWQANYGAPISTEAAYAAHPCATARRQARRWRSSCVPSSSVRKIPGIRLKPLDCEH